MAITTYTFQELEQLQNAREIGNSGEQGITDEQVNSGIQEKLSQSYEEIAIKDKERHDRVMQEVPLKGIWKISYTRYDNCERKKKNALIRLAQMDKEKKQTKPWFKFF